MNIEIPLQLKFRVRWFGKQPQVFDRLDTALAALIGHARTCTGRAAQEVVARWCSLELCIVPLGVESRTLAASCRVIRVPYGRIMTLARDAKCLRGDQPISANPPGDLTLAAFLTHGALVSGDCSRTKESSIDAPGDDEWCDLVENGGAG